MKRHVITLPVSEKQQSARILTEKNIDDMNSIIDYLDMTKGEYISMLIKRDLKQRAENKVNSM